MVTDGRDSPAQWEWDVIQDRVTWSDDLYRMFGLEPREFRASFQAYMERVHPADRERVRMVLSQALERGLTFEFEHRVLRPDGSIRELKCVGTTKRARNGQPLRMTGTSVDVTADD
jgi:PAS domain S-box-containing protein